MKKASILAALVLSTQLAMGQAHKHSVFIPDLNDYKTLKCDFHMHTVFSDGLVWPTVRIDEAYDEGLDAISLTEHLEYRPHKDDIKADHNRSYELIRDYAKQNDIILIKGSEITRNMAPGHHNALFLTDSNPLDTPDYMDAFKAAKKQDAFIFWNHPGWDMQQPEETRWWDVHTNLYEGGYMHGIEVVNEYYYFPEAHQWCLDKKLTMLGTSDIHDPIQAAYDFAKGEHRPMTLVFAKERSEAGIREALFNRRTAVFYKDLLIGEEAWLKPLFESCIQIEKVQKNEKSVSITLYNQSDLTFQLKKTAHDPALIYFRDYKIAPKCRQTITVYLTKPVDKGAINFEVSNLLVKPGKGLDYQLAF